jgi:hypothetical protein
MSDFCSACETKVNNDNLGSYNIRGNTEIILCSSCRNSKLFEIAFDEGALAMYEERY